jgi:hypothetical protein
MKSLAMLLLVLGCSNDPAPGEFICPQEAPGKTSDGDAVTVCQRLYPEAPFVHLPPDDRSSAVQTINGVIELDIGGAAPDFTLTDARLFDRDLNVYDMVAADGSPLDEKSALAKSAHFPSNRVFYLLYEVKGTRDGATFKTQSIRPIVMLQGRAIDERFLGAWEGVMSKYTGDALGNDSWDEGQPAKVRLEMTGLTPHENFAELTHIATPPLPDGVRFKAVGGVVNAAQSTRLSTGECIPSFISLGMANPLTIAEDFVFTFYRFPAMHTASSADFHIVNDYPKKLYPTVVGMAPEHNFRLQYFITSKFMPMDLRFVVHGTPFNQLVFTIRQVRGGGESCVL